MKDQTIRVTRRFTFDMAHALHGYDGLCANIHGHTYSLDVTVSGNVINRPCDPKNGMVMDFKDLKNIVVLKVISVFDHALLLFEKAPRLAPVPGMDPAKIIYTPYQPTCENLLLHIVQILRGSLPAEVRLHSVRLQETPNSLAEWFREDNNK
jgi:6-pyruvoyltetrahydropterin/6-carboxytetrahydropterin synthase